jgi:hypothetical protein
MIEEHASTQSAASEGVLRLSLAAIAMIVAGIALGEWTDGPATAAAKPPLVLAGQDR